MKKFGNKAKVLNNINEIFHYDDNYNIYEHSKSKNQNFFKESNQRDSFLFEKEDLDYFSKNKIQYSEILRNKINEYQEDVFEFKKSSKRNIKFIKENSNNIPKINQNDDYYILNKSNEKREEGKYNKFIKDKNFKSQKQYNLEDLEKNNLYFILKVKENASKEDVTKSYRELSIKLHPDKGGSADDFIKLNKAYKILSNETCRGLYDQFSIDSFNMIELILKEDE